MDDTSRRLDDAARTSGRGEERLRGYTGPESRSTAAPAGSVLDQPGGATSHVGESKDDDTEQRVVEIRAEIEQTREELSETIDAIQERLRPGNIVAGATERVKAATTEKVKEMAHTAGDTAQDVMESTRDVAGDVTRSVRDNPIPAVLIGLGTAWLLMNRSGSTPRRESRRRSLGSDSRRAPAASGYGASGYAAYGGYEQDEGYEGPGAGLLERVKQHPVPAAIAGVGLAWLALSNGDNDADYYDRSRGASSESRAYGRVRGTGTKRPVSGAYGSAASEIDSAASGIGDKAGDVASEAGELASRAQEYVGDAADEIRARSRRAQNQLQRMLRDNPLMVGAAAVVIGAAVGMALPETEREREWMGDARDSVVDRAQEMARDAASRVQEAAGDMAGELASRAVTGKDT